MSTALLVVDVQQSFTQRPYWSDQDAPSFLRALQGLIDRCVARGIPVVQIFHQQEDEGPDGPFSKHSGFVRTLPQLRIEPQEVFYKDVHSALFGRNAAGETLEQWLRRNGIDHVIVTGIRTEQCCETTTRHASDSGFRVTYAIDATLTFPMVAKSGRRYSVEELKERTELVLANRFAQVVPAEAVNL
ncbi:MAG TPA: isochorismatase family protein [Steroidobacteraceae bacterium]